MNTPFPASSSRRGSALVLVFWCLLLLSLAVFGVVELVEMSVEHAAANDSALEARSEAMSGVALGQEPQLLADDPLLHHNEKNGSAFQVAIGSEGARLNLNYILLTKHREVLVNLFTGWGVKADDAERAADCLYDWVTSGDQPSLNGAKAGDYARAGLPQRPSHLPFQSFHEVEQVMGMDRIAAAKPDWEQSLTLWSLGPLDVTAAPAENIAALFGIPVEQAQPLVRRRNESPAPLTPADFEAGLGVGDARMKEMNNQFIFGSNLRRIDSTGWSGDARCTISVVVSIDKSSPALLVWSER